MKGDIPDWGTRTVAASMTYSQVSQVSDYSVMTMKLRDQVFQAKPKTPRNYRNMRSVSSFQNRNLDNYPMPHGREDALQSARDHRQDRRLKHENMNRIRLDSEIMKDYSKQMFDSVVKCVSKSGQDTVNSRQNHQQNRSCNESKLLQNGVRNTSLSRRSKTCSPSTRDKIHVSCTDMSRNNGPTRDGSILYNSKQQLLNAIRIRPYSEPLSIFNHEKNKSKPGLNETISEKNINYTIRPNRSSLYSRAGSVAYSAITGTLCSTADYVLIPLNEDYKDMDRKFSMDLSFSDLNDSLEIDRDTCTFDDDTDVSSVFKHDTSRPESKMLPPSASHGIRLVSLDEDSSSESEEEAEEKSPHATSDQKKPEPVSQHKPMEKGSKVKGQKVPELEPEIKSERVKIVLKGPHCWVDDATITSEQSEEGLDDVVDSEQISPNDSKKPEVEKQPAVKQLSQLELQKNRKTSFELNDYEQSRQNLEITEGINLIDVTENHLPPFLCPSSEKKSREAAIKDWLAHTCFQSAQRGIPML